jgi:tripartite-type tricarboxylate transporter receptor subunit TctC
MGTGHQGSRHQHPRVSTRWPDKGRRTQLIAIAAALTFAAALGPAAFAQTPTETWPNRFIRLIVPFPPGGGADAIARILSARLSDTWGQQVVIENRGGASGNIAAEAAARSAPDGYTIFLAGDFQAVNLYLYPKLSYDPVADFAPVTLVVQYPCAMVVPNSSPARSVLEFVAYAKANNGKLTFATPGHGTSPHLAGELFKRAAGIAMTTIPYRGAAPAIQDVIPGRVDVFFNNIAPLLSLMQQGQLRALAVTTAKRVPAAPDVPTLAEAGLPGFDVAGWYAFFVPANTPPAIVRKIHADTAAALADPPIKERLEQLGLFVIGSTPAELGQFLKSEMDKWAPVIKDAGISIRE